MSAGVIYGVHVERAEVSGPMRSGPVVTVCARLPEWAVLDGTAETELRVALQGALAQAVAVVTESEKSKARRLEQDQMGTKS